jgi:hypothetical protein
VDDEAILDVTAQIIDIEPSWATLVGGTITCSFVAARSFPSKEGIKGPLLFLDVSFTREGSAMLAYLPDDAFWALQARFCCGQIGRLELTYEAPKRGRGQLRSIYFS